MNYFVQPDKTVTSPQLKASSIPSQLDLMKRLLTISMILTLLFGATDLAYSGQPDKPQKEKESKETAKSNDQPEPNLDGVVEVSFKIDQVGKVQILNINSTSPQLSEYVIMKLGKIQLEKGNSQIGKVIKYRFVFKKQA